MNRNAFLKTALTVWALALVAATTGAQAQSGSLAEAGVPVGSGAGVHSPNSPFAPLQERADVLPWSVLTAVKTKVDKNRILPVFPNTVQALNQKSQRVQE